MLHDKELSFLWNNLTCEYFRYPEYGGINSNAAIKLNAEEVYAIQYYWEDRFTQKLSKWKSLIRQKIEELQ